MHISYDSPLIPPPVLRAGGFRLNEAGYFEREGSRFVPFGVNYWPSSCGLEMWQKWPVDEIRNDLRLAREIGLNCVRFFLLWQDFEPSTAKYEKVMFDRLDLFLGWCKEYGLAAHPSLFVGWMSGGVFWPDWKKERNLFSDPEMVDRAVAFAEKAAGLLSSHHENILAVDQGNELDCLLDCESASPDQIAQWSRRIGEGIRRFYPQAIVCSGNDHNQIINDRHWHLGNQPSTDLYSVHGYPAPNWHHLVSDGMTDPLSQSLLPFYVKAARAFGPVIVQEFGTLLTRGEKAVDAYLRAVLPNCWKAGCNGFLWWCLRDISASIAPYDGNGVERGLGLLDTEGKLKPGFRFLQDFARKTLIESVSATQNEIGLYWPINYYPSVSPQIKNHPELLSSWMALANYAAQSLGMETKIVRSEHLNIRNVKTLWLTGVKLADVEVNAVADWVEQGGNLLWHFPHFMQLSPAGLALTGVELTDFRAAYESRIQVMDQEWFFAAELSSVHFELDILDAKVLVQDQESQPVIWQRLHGRGQVLCCLPNVEAQIARYSGCRGQRDRWHAFYRYLFACLEASNVVRS